jgi:hypothetical protein
MLTVIIPSGLDLILLVTIVTQVQSRRIVGLSCSGPIWAVKLHWLDKGLLYTVTDRNMVFSGTWFFYWKTERNGNSYSRRHHQKRLARRLLLLFSDYLAVVVGFEIVWLIIWLVLKLQDEQNMHTLSGKARCSSCF